MVDVGVVLCGGDDAIRSDDSAVVAVLVFVVENAAGNFDRSDTAAGLGRYRLEFDSAT